VNPLIPIILGTSVLLFARHVRARSDGGSSTGKRAYERYRTILDSMPAPIPPPVMALRIARESAGNPKAYVGGRVAGGGEAGLTQVYVPYRAERSGARGADADPLNPRGAIWASQWVADTTLQRLERELPTWNKDVPARSDVRAWIVLLEAEHSVGYAGIKNILTRWRTPSVLEAFRREGEQPHNIGRMGADLVGKRVRRLLSLPDAAAEIAPLPGRIEPLPARPADVPRFDLAKMQALDRRFA